MTQWLSVQKSDPTNIVQTLAKNMCIHSEVMFLKKAQNPLLPDLYPIIRCFDNIPSLVHHHEIFWGSENYAPGVNGKVK